MASRNPAEVEIRNNDGMTVRQLAEALQRVPPDQQDAPLFVIYNLEDGVQAVLGVRVECHGPDWDDDVDLVRLLLENESERGVQ